MNRSSYILNILIHILILFSFLSILFFAYISHVEEKSINREVKKAVNKEIDNGLQLLEKYKSYLDKNKLIRSLRNVSNYLTKTSDDSSEEIRKNNTWLIKLSITTIISLIIVIFILLVYFILYRKDIIQFKEILMENLFIFVFVGIIEYWFFANIVSKYVPVMPTLLSKTFFGNIKNKIRSQIDFSK